MIPPKSSRAILVASLDGPVGPSAPTRQAYRSGREPETEPDLFGDPLPPPVSMAEALGWGLDERPCWTVSGGRDVLVNADARAHLRDVVLRSNYGTGGDPQDRGERTADEPASTVTSKINRAKWVETAAMHPAGLTGSYGYSRPIRHPSPTIVGSGRGGQYLSDGEVSVRVTVQEAGILQSFPADYPWQGTKTAQYRQAGDAVPPLLAAAVLRPLLAIPARGAAA